MKPVFTVFWSPEDEMWVAVCDIAPSLSWLDDSPDRALRFLEGILIEEGLIG